MKLKPVELYVRRLNNPDTKDYARRYLKWLRDGEAAEHPMYTCSETAASGVRFRLTQYIRSEAKYG